MYDNRFCERAPSIRDLVWPAIPCYWRSDDIGRACETSAHKESCACRLRSGGHYQKRMPAVTFRQRCSILHFAPGVAGIRNETNDTNSRNKGWACSPLPAARYHQYRSAVFTGQLHCDRESVPRAAQHHDRADSRWRTLDRPHQRTSGRYRERHKQHQDESQSLPPPTAEEDPSGSAAATNRVTEVSGCRCRNLPLHKARSLTSWRLGASLVRSVPVQSTSRPRVRTLPHMDSTRPVTTIALQVFPHVASIWLQPSSTDWK